MKYVFTFEDEVNKNKTDGGAEELKAFEVTITETLQQSVTVMAKSTREAEETVEREWGKQDHVLDSDNFVGVKFEAALVS